MGGPAGHSLACEVDLWYSRSQALGGGVWRHARCAQLSPGGATAPARCSSKAPSQPALTPLARRLLELPPPELDALGRAAWDHGPATVSKAYRRLSVLVHPDKNPGDEARRAFEALNEAHRMLKDPSQLVRWAG